MKTYYWFFLVIAILMWNGMLIKRDAKMFEAYDRACAELPTGHPDCVFAKKK
jgi:hypothetical protein